MKKRNLLLALVLVMTFTGGFISGNFFSNNDSKIVTGKNPISDKSKVHKEIPIVENEDSNVLIGYVQDFRDPYQVDYESLTHIIFSFAHPTASGDLLLNGDSAIANLRTLVSEAHKHDKKAMLAIGGWFHINGGESYEYFKNAISNPDSRDKLVNEITTLTQRENLDGIDIDFEHPRTQSDAENLTIFMKELRNQLQNKELSIAVNAKVHSVAGTEINNVIYHPNMFQYVDYVNIMAYDGQWDGEYNAANLSPFPHNQNIVRYWTTLFDDHGLSREKLVLGVPLYAQPENPEIKQVSYGAIIDNSPENAKSDTVVLNGTTYHYNGVETVQKKTKLALDNGFGGMMLWEAGHDADGAYSLSGTISDVLTQENLLVQN
nr:glycoside hydrolase family 18 protein [Bacillus dakarensis]